MTSACADSRSPARRIDSAHGLLCHVEEGGRPRMTCTHTGWDTLNCCKSQVVNQEGSFQIASMTQANACKATERVQTTQQILFSQQQFPDS